MSLIEEVPTNANLPPEVLNRRQGLLCVLTGGAAAFLFLSNWGTSARCSYLLFAYVGTILGNVLHLKRLARSKVWEISCTLLAGAALVAILWEHFVFHGR